MIGEMRHYLYHAQVIKRRISLLPKILSGYARTLVLRQPVLRTVEFALLAECNSKCIMCYASRMKRQDDTYLTVEDYRRIWKEASRLGAFSVILSGGEPTLRKDLFDILAVMDPRNTIFALVTNSLNLNRDYLADLKRAGVETIHLSLDSTDPQLNDRIRGAAGHFNKVMEAVAEAKRQGFAVYLSTVIMHGGLKKMEEMVRFAAENDIGIVFSLACVSGNWADEHDVLLTPGEWRSVQEYMRQNPHVRSDWTINFSMRQECPGGREKLSISCYGDVMGCGMNYISFGNVREEPLETIWKRMGNFPAFKKRSPDCLIGADPDYIEKYIKPLSGMTVPVRVDCHPVNPIPFKDLDIKD
ncbi:MAG: radical SAM protein [Nitrospirae bacterium]|nr:radical SAM protein [Nitrospirota bacterium]